MSNKLFIPKSTLKGIADAIRTKTGDSNTIKVKNMPDAIQNIPAGGLDLESKIAAKFITSADEQILSVNILQEYTKGLMKLSGKIANATMHLQYFYTTGDIYTDDNRTWSDGNWEHFFTDPIQKVIISFDSEPFKAAETVVENNILYVEGYSEDQRTSIHVVNHANLLTWDMGNGNVLNNDNGRILDQVVSSRNYKIQYRGDFTNINNDGRGYITVQLLDVPETVKTLPDVFSYNRDLQKFISRGLESVQADAFKGCENLKHVRLNKSCNSIGSNSFSDCPIEHITIPACSNLGENIIDNGSDSVSSVLLNSGISCEITMNTFDLLSRNNHITHLVLAGKLKNGTTPTYQTGWIDHVKANNIGFNVDTDTIVAHSADRVEEVYNVRIPLLCTKIEESAFNHMRETSTQRLTFIFESIIPPNFDDFASTFPDSNLNFIVPEPKSNLYNDKFDSYSNVDITTDESYNGDFRIDWIGEKLEAYVDHPFSNEVDGAKVYLDNQPSTMYAFDEKFIFNTNKDIYHTIRLNQGFTYLESESFKYNQNIIGVRLPRGCSGIGSEAFMGCKNLEYIIFASCPTVSSETFFGLNPDCKFYVPESLLNDFHDKEEYNNFNLITYPDDE